MRAQSELDELEHRLEREMRLILISVVTTVVASKTLLGFSEQTASRIINGVLSTVTLPLLEERL